MMHCVQCNTELVAPERSEYLSAKHVCHIWLCPACSACFESLVLFPTDSESMGDQFARPKRRATIGTAVRASLKALDPDRPISEATSRNGSLACDKEATLASDCGHLSAIGPGSHHHRVVA
jgi:hypothetical protein